MKTSISVIFRIVLWIIFLFGGAILSFYFDIKYFKNLLLSPTFHIISFIIGIFILKISFHAASIGGKALHKYGRKGNIPRLETNQLVNKGIYSCTRHPMLFGLMFLPLSLALILGFPTFIFFIAPIEAILIFILMIYFDEKEALKKFGKEYEIYRKKVPIFPAKCWKELFFD
ncbi:methyltransferase family protein [Nitrosophilus kaiyonis]|uniref:methyltransferase family protein n=1 Tax=Nitrosophilus kaiyonis TaxID=2930200 RepID=UPI0024915414|nr:methyltransferase [Nitrosophilus kaiyonis]